ncbi:MAG TPA: YceI family protein [Saprospiraceae bacterium]|nr:YceI family protein [Saprospiraceae bacterium]MCC6688171.1 YceI family protein [Saprospiraceae bacterium]HMV23749.1 YceI family protein [Saprospiraceae bacterium]HMW74936.1 YceI family protein [Saprospiraceae bacterium]HMX84818.1 YceI family protein [Saprospiraceae bacterium]
MKNVLLFILLITGITGMNAQDKYFTKDASVSFDATVNASLETIAAKSTTGSSVIEVSTGKIEFAVLARSLKFEKLMMEQHFNENYIESNKYPKAAFKGKIDNIKDINFQKNGTYKANVSGDLTMHGVTKAIKTTATITVNNGQVNATSQFSVALKDYKIKIPAMVGEKVSKNAKIMVEAHYQKLDK